MNKLMEGLAKILKVGVGIAICGAAIIVGLVCIIDDDVAYAEPDYNDINYMCDLAVTELDYNDVARVDADYWFFGKKSKKMWIEHKSAVKVGVDANEIKVDSGKNKVTVTVPKAKVLSVNVDENSFNANSYSISNTRLRKITAKEQNKAMQNANKDIRKIVSEDPVLMHEAQKRTKKVLGNYFETIMHKTGDKRKLEVSLE